MTMISMKIIILYICVCLAIYVNNVKCDEDDSLFQYDGETSMSNIDDANKEIYEDVKSKRDINKVNKSECAPEKRITRESIESMRNKREKSRQGLVGAPTDTDADETQKVIKLVTAALAEDSLKPDSRKYGLHRVKSSTKQVVAGILYKIDAEFILPNNEIKDCTIQLLVKEWIKPEPTIEKLDCGEDEITRKKRSLIYDYRRDEPVEETEYNKVLSNIFNEFKATFNKKYESAMEHATRLRIFEHNLHIIDELNRLEQGTATYGITEFADYTKHEYIQRTGMLRRTVDNEIPNAMAEIPNIDLPTSFDWREKGAVSEVKNQGNCGSCWAFSVIGNIEGINAIKNGKLEEFSEQELVDCDTVDQGCNGGLPDNAYKAIEQLGGLETESQYPYSAKKSKCQFDETLARVKISGAVDLPQNETQMAQYLVQNGPLSIGINANAMQFYRGGISHPPRILCRHSSIDHGVLIVGFGVADYPVFNKTLPFWIIKNSWGPTWGEQGYYRVFRGANTCGLNSMVSSAVLE